MKNDNCFSSFHPAFLFVYYISVIGITVFSSDCILLGLSFVGALIFEIILSGQKAKKDIFYICLLVSVLSLSNPLFSQNGVTVLFYIGDLAYTLEALLYGVNSSVMIAAVIMWFKCLNLTFSDDKFQYLFSRILPKTTLAVTMIMRFIPLYIKNIREINDTNRAMGLDFGKSIPKKIKNASTVFLTLVTQSLENSVETSFSMAARNYATAKRTSFGIYKLRAKDVILSAVTVLFTALFLFAKAKGILEEFGFYPTLYVPQFSLISSVLYIMFGAVALLPVLTNISESIKWKYYLSKI